jgi:hypothetical protein
MQRHISNRVSFSGEKTSDDKPYFSHALGVPVSSRKAEARLAKSKGLIEIGNEKVAHSKIKPERKDLGISQSEYHDVMRVSVGSK